MTAWYGMNMPNRISVNTTSAPGKRQRDSTNPLAAPISDEISATGIASWNVRRNDGSSAFQALAQEAKVQCSGRFHWPLTPISLPALKLVTSSTYSGISIDDDEGDQQSVADGAPGCGGRGRGRPAAAPGRGGRERPGREASTVLMTASPPG